MCQCICFGGLPLSSNKVPHAGWLKITEIVPQFWRLEVCNQAEPCFLLKLRRENPFFFSVFFFFFKIFFMRGESFLDSFTLWHVLGIFGVPWFVEVSLPYLQLLLMWPSFLVPLQWSVPVHGFSFHSFKKKPYFPSSRHLLSISLDDVNL